jgi:cytochrome c oxidase assembly protein subunit 11
MSNIASKNTRVAVLAGSVCLGMLGLAYASVPLYRLFCQATGFGGTTQRSESAPQQISDQSISVRFDANVSTALGWTFHPENQTMTVKIGEVNSTNYIAENKSSDTMTGSAVFNVTPSEAGVYFNKISCFCFTEQTLKAGERVAMPVQFFVDPAILDDLDARGIKEITLSYTFYPATPKATDDQAALKTNTTSN